MWGSVGVHAAAQAVPLRCLLPLRSLLPACRAEGSGSTADCWELSKGPRLRHGERKALRGESGVTRALLGR